MSNSPIATLGADDIALEGTVNIEAILNEQPQILASATSSSNNPGNGFATVNLRGLGTARTLVLVNSRRFTPATLGGAVDLNNIPTSLIENVEVITGGASSVYGSDAVAGVVNFKLKQDFEGFQLDTTAGITDEGDGEFIQVSGLWGANLADGRGNVTFFANYTNRSSVLQGDRDFSFFDLEDTLCVPGSLDDIGIGTPADPDATDSIPCFTTSGSSFNEFTNIFTTPVLPTNVNGIVPGVAVDAPVGSTLTTTGPDGNVIQTFSDALAYNFNPVNFLQLPQDRFTAYGAGHYEILPDKRLEIFGEGTYSFNNVVQQLAPTPTVGAIGFSVPTSITNPFIPDNLRILLQSRVAADIMDDPDTPEDEFNNDSDGDGIPNAMDPDSDGNGVVDAEEDFVIRRRLTEVGPRVISNENDAFYGLIGFRGEVPGTDWGWETSYSFGRSQQLTFQSGDASEDRFQQALGSAFVNPATGNPVLPVIDPATGVTTFQDQVTGAPVDVSGLTPECVSRVSSFASIGTITPDSDCVPINIFGGPGTTGEISPEGAAFIEAFNFQELEVTQQIFQASLAGTAFELPAGPLGFALGFEWRDVSGLNQPDEFLNSGDSLGFGGFSPTSGSFDVVEGYFETSIPVLKDVPFVDYLGIDGAVRISNYSTVGTVVTFKGGGEYAPIEGLRFRGLFQRAIRAPSVGELFQGQAQNFPSADDPCDVNEDPLADPVVAALCIAQGVPEAVLGVATLGSGGQVLEITGGNPDLGEETSNSFTVGAVFSPSFFEGFTATVDYYSISIDDAIDQIGGGAQGILDLCFGQDTPDNTSEFCTPISRAVTGTIDSILATNANVSNFQTRGIDFSFAYDTELADWGIPDPGTIGYTFLGTYVFENTIVPFDGADPINSVGFIGIDAGGLGGFAPADPEFRYTSRVTYDRGRFGASVQTRFVTSVDVETITPTTFAPSTGSEFYVDLTLSYQPFDWWGLTFGIENLFDNDPTPLDGDDAPQANTDPGTFDTLGRRFFLTTRLNF